MDNKNIQTILKDNPQILTMLGKELYNQFSQTFIENITEVSEQNCIDYINNTTYDCFIIGKSVVNDNLAKIFTDVRFEESEPEQDHSLDIVIWAGSRKDLGIQIKPVTSKSNFGTYCLPKE